MKQTTAPLTATKLRIILIAALFGIGLLASGVFYVGYHQLDAMAATVSHATADANASNDTLSNLQRTERELAANQTAVDRASKIVADSKQYNYQNAIITDLQTYASRAGITISTFDFSANSSSAAPATSGGAKPGAASPSAVSGLQTTKVTLTLKNPVSYTNLLHFLRSIEQNLTKLQIASVGLSKGDKSDAVSANSLTLEFYTK